MNIHFRSCHESNPTQPLHPRLYDSTTPNPETMATTQPFRLMDLQLELRLMVYESLEGRVRHTRVDLPAKKDCLVPVIILITRTLLIALLRVSREVNHEAKPTVVRLVEDLITSHPARIMSSYYVARKIMYYLLKAVISPQFQTVDKQGIARLSDSSQDKYTNPNSAGPKFLHEDSVFEIPIADIEEDNDWNMVVNENEEDYSHYESDNESESEATIGLCDVFSSLALRSQLFLFMHQAMYTSSKVGSLQAEVVIV
jgi:hypothetical protein